MKFILASSSPRRRELLSSLGISFTVIKPDIDETQRPNEPPLAYVARLSYQKAEAVASYQLLPVTSKKSDALAVGSTKIERNKYENREGQVILAADTLGVDEHGDILGKPVDANNARNMLRRLRGRTHQVCTAMTLSMIRAQNRPTLEYHTHVTRTDVTMRDYSDAEIDAYIASGDPFDKAGSYAIQHPIFRPVANIDGCYTNVVGLPLCTLKNMLAVIGWPGIEIVEGCDCALNMLPS